MATNKAELQAVRDKLKELQREEKALALKVQVDDYIAAWKACADIKKEMETLLKQKLAAKGISRQAYNKAKDWYDYSYKKENRYLTAVDGESASIQSLISTSGKTANELKANADERREKAARSAINERRAASEKRKKANDEKKASEASKQSSKKTENDLKQQDASLARLQQG